MVAYRRSRGLPEDAEAELLLCAPPAILPRELAEMKEIILMLISDFPFIRFSNIPFESLSENFKATTPIRDKARFLRAHYGENAFTEVYYSHDVNSDYAAQGAMQAYPHAARVCFGDSCGTVYSLPYMNSLRSPFRVKDFLHPKKALRYTRNKWRALQQKRRLFAGAKPMLDAQVAALMIPSDPGRDFIKGKELIIPSRDLSEQVAVRMAKSLADFRAYISNYFDSNPAPRYLLILTSLSKGGLTTPEGEISLYLEIVGRHVPKGASILIKRHPASEQELVEEIRKRLSADYKISLFESKFMSIPIELAPELIRQCTTLSMSYPSISLPYLYRAEATHVLDDALLRKYIFPAYLNMVREGNDLYIDMIKNMKSWDYRSVLYPKAS